MVARQTQRNGCKVCHCDYHICGSMSCIGFEDDNITRLKYPDACNRGIEYLCKGLVKAMNEEK